MFSTAAAPFYIPINSAQMFQFFSHLHQHVLFSVLFWFWFGEGFFCFLFFDSSHPNGYEMLPLTLKLSKAHDLLCTTKCECT